MLRQVLHTSNRNWNYDMIKANLAKEMIENNKNTNRNLYIFFLFEKIRQMQKIELSQNVNRI